MTIDVVAESESYLDRLKSSLTVSAVLKAELGAAKSACGDARIFAYEGVDDKVIYAHWLSRIEPDLDYEPFICRNKDQLVQLWNSLKRDLTGMSENVYFFTDRDFDDLKGHEADESIYMTEKYSVENYLVDRDVLNELLKVELHCHGSSQVREKIISMFETAYGDFLNIAFNINFRIYLARKCKIKQLEDISVRLDDLACIQLESVQNGNGQLDQMVCLEREPSESEMMEYESSFKLLEPRKRYRGKFSLQFFRKWLTLLLADRNSTSSHLFDNLPQNDFVAKGGFSFDQLAAKSKPPESFQRFIAKSAASLRPTEQGTSELRGGYLVIRNLNLFELRNEAPDIGVRLEFLDRRLTL